MTTMMMISAGLVQKPTSEVAQATSWGNVMCQQQQQDLIITSTI